jgi:hypothetical protein
MYTSVRGIDIPLFQEKCQKYLFIKNNRKTVENKGNNKITELRTIFQRESQNS